MTSSPTLPQVYCRNKKHREYILITFLYLAITLSFTYPLILNFTTHIPGNGGDGPHFLWNLWKIQDSVLNLRHFYKTDFVFYPIGTNLITHTYAPIIGVVSIPFSLFLSNVTTYNILVICAFVLNGLGCFALIKYLTKSTVPSFLGGVIFAFSPNFFGHLLGHFDMLWGSCMPLFILFFLKMTKEPRWRNIILSSVFFLLTFLTSYYYAVFLALLVALFIVFTAFANYRFILQKVFWKPILSFFIITVIFLSPFLALYFQEVTTHPYVDTSSLHGNHFTSADLLDFIIPTQMNQFYQYFFNDLVTEFKTQNISERNLFVGYSILAFALLTIFNRKIENYSKYFWFFCLVFFVVFSCGEELSINNNTRFRLFNTDFSIPLFYGVYRKIPVLNGLRTPVRCDVLVVLCVAVLSSFSISYYLQKARSHRTKTAMTAVILVIFLMEYLPTPYPLYKLPFSPILNNVKKDPADCTVLEIPIGISDGFRNLYHDSNSTHMYHQTLHGKRMFGGYVARLPEHVFRYFQKEPVIATTIYLQRARDTRTFRGSKSIGSTFSERYGLKYIIINKKDLTRKTYRSIMKWFEQIFDISESWHDPDICLLRITSEPNLGFTQNGFNS